MKASSSPYAPPTSGSSELKGARILLVEDSWHVGNAIKRLLRTLGADVAGPAATIADAGRLVAEVFSIVAVAASVLVLPSAVSTQSVPARILVMPFSVQAAPTGNRVTGWVGQTRGFLVAVREEMRKVTWPTRDELIKATRMIIILALLLGVAIGLLDWVLQLILVEGVARLAR